ncbi:MAG: threonine aldolase family protein [Chloroflexota bacterium]
MQKSLASDNYSGAHPQVMQAILDANQGHVTAYGGDPYTRRAEGCFQQLFGTDVQVYFVFSGTAANVLCLKAALRSHQAVICSDVAHIHVDETGAAEAIAGVKLLTVPAVNGKLTVEGMQRYTQRFGDDHFAQPRLVSITQPTERGTLYTLQEISEIAAFCRRYNLLLHMDGARIANAAAALDLPVRAFTRDLGVDLLSFGGTKNGLLLGEAVVFFNPALALDFQYIRMQTLQLSSKMRFISAQFEALLTGDLWLHSARHANRMAARLAAGLERLPQVTVKYPVQTNAIFATLPLEQAPALQAEFPFYVWDETTGEVRWMASFDTTETEIDRFLALLAAGAVE